MCGVYQIAEIYAEVIQNHFPGCFSDVVFAIPPYLPRRVFDDFHDVMCGYTAPSLIPGAGAVAGARAGAGAGTGDVVIRMPDQAAGAGAGASKPKGSPKPEVSLNKSFTRAMFTEAELSSSPKFSLNRV